MTPLAPSLMCQDGAGSPGFRRKRITAIMPTSWAHLSPTDPAEHLKNCWTADGDGSCLQPFLKMSWKCHSCSVLETLGRGTEEWKEAFPASGLSQAQPLIATTLPMNSCPTGCLNSPEVRAQTHTPS